VKKPRGRPPLDPSGRSLGVHVRLSPRLFDDVYARAQRERVTVTAIIRRALEGHSVAPKSTTS